MNQQLIKTLKDGLKKNPKFLTCISRFKKYKELKNAITNATSFLPEDARLNERVYCIFNNISERPTCLNENCSNKVNYDRLKKQYAQFCSSKCSNSSNIVKQKKVKSSLKTYGTKNPKQSEIVKKKYKQTCLERYGVEHYSLTDEYKKKYKQTCLERYGVTTTAILKDVQNKRKQTCLERYGSEFPICSEKIQEKIKQTNIKRYGTEYFVTTDTFKKKSKETCLKRYNRTNRNQQHIEQHVLDSLNSKEWLIEQHHTLNKPMLQIANELGVCDTTIAKYLDKHNIEKKIYSISQYEREISDFLKSVYKPEFIQTTVYNKIKTESTNKEIDIYISDKRLGIEFCGIFWHSEYYKDKNYHLDKLNAAISNNIKLVQIFENEWIHKQDIIKRKLKHLLGLNDDKIYARKTVIKEVNRNEKKRFFEKYHIQGNGKGSINYGLYENNDLVACITFTKRKEGVFEINRYATSKTVVGGFSKLLKHFQKHHEWSEIITFADRRWSEGDLYLKTGFELNETLKPDYKYIKGNNVYHKFNFRHKGMKQKLENYDPTLTEHQNMLNHGYYRIYDCGLHKFSLKNKKSGTD